MAIDLSTPSATFEQTVLAFTLVILGIAGLLYLRYRSRYAGLPDDRRRARADLEAARATVTPRSIRLPRETDFGSDATRQRLAALFDPESDAPAGGIRHAVREVRGTIVHATVGRIPRFARRLLSLASTVAVLGAMAVSTGLLLRALRADTGRLYIENWPQIALEESAAVADRAITLLFMVPGVEMLWALGFSFVIIFGEWLYTHWYVTAAGLLLGAALVTWLVRRGAEVPSIAEIDLPTPGRVLAHAIIAFLFVWTGVLVGVGVGREIGPDWWGVRAGLIVGSGVALFIVVFELPRAFAVVRQAGRRLREATGEAGTWTERALVLVWLGSLGLAVAVAPLVPIYALVALTKLPTLIGAFLAADLGVKALALLVVVLVGVVLAYLARESWDDVGPAMRDVLASSQVRIAVAKNGFPLVAVAATYVAVYPLFGDDSLFSILVVGTFGVAVGLAVRSAAILLLRARYHLGRRQFGRDDAARRVVVQGARLEVDGGEQCWARVNGTTELLHPDEAGIVDAIATVADELTTTGEAEPTIAEWHARLGFDAGVTDVAETERVVSERVRKLVFDELRSDDAGMVDREAVDERLEELPEDVVAERFADWRRRGEIAEQNDYVVLRHDPMAN